MRATFPRTLIFLSTACCLLLTVRAQAAERDWIEIGNGRVRVVVEAKAPEIAAARELVKGIEARRQLLSALLDLPLAPTEPLSYFFFVDQSAAKTFGAHEDGARRLKAGYESTTLALGAIEPQRQTLQRSAVNTLIGEHLSALPVFWQAGFEQFLLDVEVGPEGTRPLPPNDLLLALRKDGWYSLGQFSEIGISHHTAETQRRLAAQVWAVIYHDAVYEPKLRPRLIDFVHRMLKGESAVSAFTEAYGTYYDAIQLKVRDHVLRKGTKGFEKKMPAWQLTLPEIDETPLSVADSNARFGLLLVDLKKPAEAEQHCKAALAMQPDHPRAQLCRARLLELQGELQSTRELLESTAAAAPGDPWVAYFAGHANLLPNAADPAARPAVALAHLRRARALLPALGDAWADAAVAAYFMNPQPEDVLKLAQESQRRVPRRTDASLLLYRLYEARGQKEEATALVRQDPLLRGSLPTFVDSGRGPVNLPAGATASALDSFHEANAMMAAGQFAEALALLERLRRVGDNPSLAGNLDAKIAEIRQVIAHNNFAADYSAAVEEFNQQRYDEAIAALEAMLPHLQGEDERGKTAALLQKAEDIRAARKKVAIHNHFAAVLNQANVLYNARKLKEAAELVESVLPTLVEPADQQLAKTFIERCRGYLRSRGGG